MATVGKVLRLGQMGTHMRCYGSAPGGCVSLTGQVAWVIGGAGVIGRGICRGLLKAGATVIIATNSQTRLEDLHRDLGNPDNLIGVKGTMRPSGARDLVKQVMEMTNLRLNHVIAHTGARWWSRSAKEALRENELGLGKAKLGLDEDPAEFVERAAQLPALHYTAAQLLLPHLKNIEGSSYTFVTGGAGEQMSIEAQVNAHGVWGIAAALRGQYSNSPVRVSEIRLNIPHRAPAEKDLSLDVGELCAGMVSNPQKDSDGLHSLTSMEDINRLKAILSYPSVVEVPSPSEMSRLPH